MICSNCGSANPPGAKFCNECASRLVAVCPTCGTANAPGAKFCSECATPLQAAAAGAAGRGGAASAGATGTGAAAGATPAGATERRLVSVLFADLVGFTPLAADRDPEETRELLRSYFDAAREVIGRYGGTLEKFIGDAVMAVWGAPTAHEDDAERAVRAALDLTDVVPGLGARAGVDLQVRAGVLTGEAAVAVGAVGEGLVAGDLVNTASRLQSVAGPGTVLVGEATRAATHAAIAFEPVGEVALKGKTLPVAAYRALRVIGERGGGGRADALEPPFVGRSDELRLLKEQFHATGRERRARLVSLVGQAGIGKSRLAWEMEKYLDGVVEPVWWHRGRSPSYGDGITFWALGEMIRRRAGLAEGDDEVRTREAVAAMLARHVPDAEERRWIEPRILALLGTGESPSGGREELFAAWRTFFERIAEEGTVALVFEDVQWADDGLLDFIEHLLDWSRSHPIFVVTLARPELLTRRPGWGADRRGAISMRLEPLTPAAMRELLDGLVPGLPEKLVEQILARADGIPLYAVEIVRMLVSDGRLRRDGEVYRPATTLDAIEVPATLHALVAARLDALPVAERELLQDASVLGHSFTVAALSAVTGVSAESLAPRLAALVRQELLAIESDPRAPTRGQHAFVQSLLREVAYATLPKRDRRTRHLAAARYFESLEDEELAGALATHYVAAYRAAPEGPEGEAAAAQARVALRAAADRAESLGAMGQAIESLKAAREVTRDPVGDAELLLRIGELEWFATRYDDAEASLEKAARSWAALGDPARNLGAIAMLIGCQLSRAAIGRALETAAGARAQAEALADQPGAGRAVAMFSEAYARALFRSDRSAEVLEWTERALPLAEALQLDETIAMALITKGSALEKLGRRREGVALLRGAIHDARSHGLYIPTLRGTNNLVVNTFSVDPRESLELLRQAIALSRRLGLSAFATYLAGNMGCAERTGDWAWAREATSDLLETVVDEPSRQYIRDMGNWPNAWRGIDLAGRPEAVLAEAQAESDPQGIVNAREWLMDAAFTGEAFDEAVRHGRELLAHENAVSHQRAMVGRAALHAADLALAREVAIALEPSPGGAADADLAAIQAGIAALEGRTPDALELYRTALEIDRDMGLRFDLALIVLDMAALIGPGEAAVRAVAPEGRAILAELGATPLVVRLDRLMAAADDGRAGRPEGVRVTSG